MAIASNPGILRNNWSTGRSSWFGQYGYGPYKDEHSKLVWRDTGDNGRNASGLPQTVPGVAFLNRATLKHFFAVEAPNGKTLVVQHVDIGPASWTGKLIDINAPAAERLGYTPQNFPTGSVWKWKHLGPTLPAGLTLGQPYEQRPTPAAQPEKPPAPTPEPALKPEPLPPKTSPDDRREIPLVSQDFMDARKPVTSQYSQPQPPVRQSVEPEPDFAFL